MAKKVLTLQQAETAKKRAVNFLDRVLDRPERAGEVEAETLTEWAEETGRTIKSNPKRRQVMAQTATPTKADLQDVVDRFRTFLKQRTPRRQAARRSL